MMKSNSLDVIHNKLKKQILLTESFTEINGLATIIKMCRLKPHSYLLENKNDKLILYKWWIDEFNNSLKIIKNKRLKITYNDLSLDKNKIISTDLYYGLLIDKIYKISKLAFFFCGREEDLSSECAFLAFLGIDNYLRCFMFLHNEWLQISPLHLGLTNLKLIAKNLDIKYFLELKNKENFAIPCVSGQAWLTCLPVSENLLTILDRQSSVVIPALTPKKELVYTNGE